MTSAASCTVEIDSAPVSPILISKSSSNAITISTYVHNSKELSAWYNICKEYLVLKRHGHKKHLIKGVRAQILELGVRMNRVCGSGKLIGNDVYDSVECLLGRAYSIGISRRSLDDHLKLPKVIMIVTSSWLNAYSESHALPPYYIIRTNTKRLTNIEIGNFVDTYCLPHNWFGASFLTHRMASPHVWPQQRMSHIMSFV